MTLGIKRTENSRPEWVQNVSMFNLYELKDGYLLTINYFGDDSNYDINCIEFYGAKDAKQIDIESK